MPTGIKLKFILKKLYRSYHQILEIATRNRKTDNAAGCTKQRNKQRYSKKRKYQGQNKTAIPAQNITENSCNHNRNDTNIQKHPFWVVLRERCSENMQQIYRRTTMPKCDSNKVPKQVYWNHTSVWVFSCKFAAYFQNTFL